MFMGQFRLHFHDRFTRAMHAMQLMQADRGCVYDRVRNGVWPRSRGTCTAKLSSCEYAEILFRQFSQPLSESSYPDTNNMPHHQVFLVATVLVRSTLLTLGVDNAATAWR